MTASARKFALTAHVGTSVGWLGAVVAFLVLSIAGLMSERAEIVRGAYIAMNLIGQYAIVPLSLAALLTGLIQAFGTHWGLFRHYWVVTKFMLTLIATLLLLLHQFVAVAGAARRASQGPLDSLPAVGGLGRQLVFDASAAVIVLLMTTILSIYKPWGRIRAERGETSDVLGETSAVAPLSRGLKIVIALVAAIIATIVVVHLAGGGMGRH